MCGIAGTVQRTGCSQSQLSALERMTSRMKHRGPDGFGHHRERIDGWEVALGHRRLSIIDLEGGRQPLSNEDGSVQITFNGEIYNFPELRAKLGSHQFATRSDTEVIVHHYEEHGAGGLAELNGMFAFAIWDSWKRQLLLARDRAGIKPLYYASLPDGGIAFASELTALLEHPSIERRLSREAIASYLFSDYVPQPGAMIEGVSKLEPGHFICWQNGKLSTSAPFWGFDHIKTVDTRSEDELSRHLGELIAKSVERQMVSDVPIGVFLSGGIDSSTVAAHAQKLSKEPIQTFSIGFEDASFDEGAFARHVARHIGSRHTEETLSEGILVETADQALLALDEPMADPSLIPTYLLSRLAARHVKVALGGDGGDELWGGYPTYKAYRYGNWYGAMPPFLRSAARALASELPIVDRYQSFEWKLKRFTQRFEQDYMLRHLRWLSAVDLPEVRRLAQATPGALAFAGQRPFEDELNSLLALDFSTFMPGSVLAKVDRASMAHSLEVRPPLLDNELIDFAFSVPSRHKIRGTSVKHLLKRAVAGLIPDEIIHRPKKGFGIPLAAWLRGPMRMMVNQALRESPLWSTIDRSEFMKWNQEHQDRSHDHAKALWALVVLDHWVKRENIRCVDRSSSPALLAS